MGDASQPAFADFASSFAMINPCDIVGSVGIMNRFPDFRVPSFEMKVYNRRFHECNVIIDAAATQIHYPDHWGGLSVKCAFNGSEHYQTSKTHYRVNDTSFLIFNEGNYYSSWIDEQRSVNSFTLNMTPSFERDVTTSLIGSAATMLDDPDYCAGQKIRFLECLYPHGGPMTQLMVRMREGAKDLARNHVWLEEKFYELFVAMYRLQSDICPFRVGELRYGSRMELYQRLLHARDYILSSFSEDLTLSAIANVANLNKFHFLRQFKKHFGITPHQALTRARIDAAKVKLRTEHDSVISVCQQTGFSDPASFSRLFRRMTGLSPVEYRSVHVKG